MVELEVLVVKMKGLFIFGCVRIGVDVNFFFKVLKVI